MESRSIARRVALMSETPSNFRDVNVRIQIEKRRILHNRCQCPLCLDIIESKTCRDFVQCHCGAIFTDGGTDYIRRGGENIIDLTKYANLSEVQTV